MPRDNLRGQHARQRIAQLAAQLMAEHGIKDRALAKRKAARQLGVSVANWLPSNEEIDQELRAYVDLFEPDSHDGHLAMLRRQAIEAMAMLSVFNPLLTGAVASGTASMHTDIELEVYADSSKEFEQFLLNRNIPFKSEERRGGSFFTLYAEPADIEIHLLPIQAMQSAPRSSRENRRRLSLEALQSMMEADNQVDGANTVREPTDTPSHPLDRSTRT